jgi:hypothetical protein
VQISCTFYPPKFPFNLLSVSKTSCRYPSALLINKKRLVQNKQSPSMLLTYTVCDKAGVGWLRIVIGTANRPVITAPVP